MLAFDYKRHGKTTFFLKKEEEKKVHMQSTRSHLLVGVMLEQ